jgi:hypothetical protein
MFSGEHQKRSATNWPRKNNSTEKYDSQHRRHLHQTDFKKSEGELASVQAQEVYVGTEVRFHPFLNSAMDENE